MLAGRDSAQLTQKNYRTSGRQVFYVVLKAVHHKRDINTFLGFISINFVWKNRHNVAIEPLF